MTEEMPIHKKCNNCKGLMEYNKELMVYNCLDRNCENNKDKKPAPTFDGVVEQEPKGSGNKIQIKQKTAIVEKIAPDQPKEPRTDKAYLAGAGKSERKVKLKDLTKDSTYQSSPLIASILMTTNDSSYSNGLTLAEAKSLNEQLTALLKKINDEVKK